MLLPSMLGMGIRRGGRLGVSFDFRDQAERLSLIIVQTIRRESVLRRGEYRFQLSVCLFGHAELDEELGEIEVIGAVLRGDSNRPAKMEKPFVDVTFR